MNSRAASKHEPSCLAISIVTYAPIMPILEKTLSSLQRAVDFALAHSALAESVLIMVDNGPTGAFPNDLRGKLTKECAHNRFCTTELIQGHGNIGYGAGHNLAIDKTDCELHLVMNPDVWLETDALYQALTFMASHPEIGLLAPAVVDGEGNPQYLCKRYPSVLDLLLRGFAPPSVRRIFRERLYRYELRDLIDHNVIFDVPIVSGCFMLVRRSVLTQIRGFSPAYFLYFEDFDISLRAARVSRTAYVPSVRITHLGGHTARKGWRHIGMFLRSATTFFNRHGWKWF